MVCNNPDSGELVSSWLSMLDSSVLIFILGNPNSKINEFVFWLSSLLASISRSVTECRSDNVGNEVSELSLILVLAVLKDDKSEIPVWLGSVCDKIYFSIIGSVNWIGKLKFILDSLIVVSVEVIKGLFSK